MNQINLDINKSGQIINEPVVLRVGDKDQTITANLLKDGQPYTSFTTATFFANKPSGAIVANDPANVSNGVITYTVPQALVNEFGKITNAYFLIDGKVSTESFVIAVLQGVNISDDLNDYIPGMSNLNVIYDKWKDKLQAITDELNGVDAPKEVKNVIDNELKNYTDQVNELQKRITAAETQLNALEVPEIGGRNYLLGTTDNLTTAQASGFNKGLPSYTVNMACSTATTFTARAWLHPYAHPMLVQIAWLDASNTAHYTSASFAITAGSSGYSTLTITIPAGGTLQYVTAVFDESETDTTQVDYKEFKLEKGNVATDWTPAPEDKVNVSDANALQAQVDNSAVGTNLLIGTSSSEQSYTSDFSTTPGWNWDSAQLSAVSVGSTYTYSIYLTKLTGSFILGYWGYDSNKKHTGWFPSGFYSSLGKNSCTFTIPSGISYISPHVVHNSNDFTCTAKEEKLELGSQATDWCPNPSEVLTKSDYAKIKAAIVALGGALS